MTNYTFAQLGKWAAKTKKRQDVVFKQAVSDLISDIKIVPGKMRGGNPQRGQIPRDLGVLANSLQATLYGTTSLTAKGTNAHIMVVGSMSAGDTVVFSWGGAAANYAKHVHYGTRYMSGTFWIDVAAQKWPKYVREATRRAIAQVNG